MASFFSRVKDNMTGICSILKNKINARYRVDVKQVVHKYDAFLQHGLVTTSSLQNILDDKLNSKRRALQLAYMLYYCLYVIPRYGFVSLLYFQDEKTRVNYEFLLADYTEEMGMLGRTFNVGIVTFSTGILANNIVLRRLKGRKSLEFLTDWLKRIPNRTSIEDGNRDEITAPGDLDNQSRHKLISGLHYKLIAAKIMARNTIAASQSFDLIAYLVFIYKRRPSFFVTCLGLWNCITMFVCLEIATYHLNSLYLSYILTTDYFKIVINNIIRKVDDLKNKEMTNQNVVQILDDYDFIMNKFKNYNRVLKPLLGNLVHFYIFALTTMFFAFTVATEIWMVIIIIFAAGGLAFIILATGVYVSQLHAKVIELHNTLASFCARHSGNQRQRLSLNSLYRLKHAIQELGSLETDGQFVIGLRDGEGAATSRMEIFDLTMETVSNTLMIFGIVNGVNAL